MSAEGNTFDGNQANLGGGLCHRDVTSTTLRANEFLNNTAQQGGAIWLSAETDIDISMPDDNVYRDNQPDDIYEEPKDG